MDLNDFFDKNQTDRNLSENIFHFVKDNFSPQDTVIIGVSGGSTPFEMYKLLAPKLIQLLNDKMIEEIIVLQIDERYVPSSSDRSNQGLLRDIFVDPIIFHPMFGSDVIEPLDAAVNATNLEYLQVIQSREKNSMDIAILGMGNDAHTASLFPHNSEYIRQLMQNTKSQIETIAIGMYVEAQGEERISLTSHFINKSTRKILYIYGDDKTEILREAINSRDLHQYPILSVITDLIIYTISNPKLEELRQQVYSSSLSES